jgi:hypothetical protein
MRLYTYHPATLQQGLERTGPAKDSKTHSLRCTDPDLTRQQGAVQMFELKGDQTKSFMWPETRLLEGYKDPLLLLWKAHPVETMVGSLSISRFMRCSTACIFHIVCSWNNISVPLVTLSDAGHLYIHLSPKVLTHFLDSIWLVLELQSPFRTPCFHAYRWYSLQYGMTR